MKNQIVPQGFYKQLHYLKLDLNDVRKRLIEPLDKVAIIFHNGERIKLIRRTNGHWVYRSPFLVNYDLNFPDELALARKDLLKVLSIRHECCARCKNQNPLSLSSAFNTSVPICNDCFLIETLEVIQGSKFEESNKYYL